MADAQRNPLEGKRVVITRAAEQSAPLMAALRERGAHPLLVPMISFAPPDDSAPLDDAILHIQLYHWVFLTSQNAIRALQERCLALGLSMRDVFAATRLAAVGPVTEAAARAAGLQVAYVAEKHQGVSLAEELSAQVHGKRVLLPRSDRANADLVEILHTLGAQVQEVVAYKTIQPNDGELQRYRATLREPLDAILFFSPSAVHHLENMLGADEFHRLSQVCAFAAIGPVTERALREAHVEGGISARDTTTESILDALTEHFAQRLGDLRAGAKSQ